MSINAALDHYILTIKDFNNSSYEVHSKEYIRLIYVSYICQRTKHLEKFMKKQS